ncbi:MAG: glycosyltransferase family 4 protein [Eubacteriales bacterium]
MKTIMILTNSDKGLHDFRNEVLLRLIEKSYQVVIVSPMELYREYFESIGCKCIPMEIQRRGMNPITDFKLFQAYRRLLKKMNPYVVLTYTIKPNVYGGLACRIQHITYFSNVTGLGTSLTGNSKMKHFILMLYRMGLKGARCVFFQNKTNLEFMQKYDCIQAKVRLLPGSGINLEEFAYETYPEEGTIRLLTIGRIMKDKGIRELLNVIPQICEEFDNVIFELLGEYEEEDRILLEPIIENLQKAGMIRYYGYQENAREYIKKAHILIHPSYHEGMSNVMLEAAATGRPIIASDIPGCREIIQDGRTGMLCKSKEEESLYKSLHTMLKKSTQEREEMGQAGREYVEKHFSRTLVVDAYLEEIKAVTQDTEK